MIVTRRTAWALHGAALGAMILGLWAWDAQGGAVWRDGIFSFCF